MEIIKYKNKSGNIYEIRGLKVMLDEDLAELYGVETKVLNQAVSRNKDRFPPDFMFSVTQQEFSALRSQFVTSKRTKGGRRYLPTAFTEHGILMLSSVLRSKQAVKVNIQIMRTFVALRESAQGYEQLINKLKELEDKYDKQFKIVFNAIEGMLEIEERSKVDKEIGFKLE